MRYRLPISAFIILAGTLLALAEEQKPPERSVTVFQVGDGKRYHRQDCPHCRRKGDFIGEAIELGKARLAGLTPCQRCKPPTKPGPARMAGKVVRVIDGDTISVLVEKTERRIRLEGIDAPEKGQAFGLRAKQALSDKIFGQQVTVAVVGKDDYGRLLGHVYVDERWINLEMVEDGWARHFKRYSADKRLAAAEEASWTWRVPFASPNFSR